MRLRKNKNLSRVAALAVAATMMAASVAPAAIAAAPQKEAEVPAAQSATDSEYISVVVSYVDQDTNEVVGTQTISDAARYDDNEYKFHSATFKADKLEGVPGYDMIDVTDGDISTSFKATDTFASYTVYVKKAEAPATKSIEINYRDEENAESKFVTVENFPADEFSLSMEVAQANLPDGYEIIGTAPFAITTEGYAYVSVKKVETPAPATKTLYIEFVDEATGEAVGDGATLEVAKDATTAKHSDVTAPDGYEFCEVGDFYFGDSVTVSLKVRKIVATKTLYIEFVDEATGESVGDGATLEVAKDAVNANYSAVTAPDGYEFCESGDFAFGNNVTVSLKVRKVATTKTLYIEFVDEATGESVGDGATLEVAKDATTAKYSDVTAPDGYEFCEVGDFYFGKNATVSLKVREVVTTKTVKINFYDETADKQLKEETLTVAKDAEKINSTDIEYPEGYEINKETTSYIIRDGYVYVGLKQVATTKTISINYVDEATGKSVGKGTLVVDKDATYANLSQLTTPDGYVTCEQGDFSFNGKDTVDVMVRKVTETKTIAVEFVTEDGETVGKGSLVVDKDATYANYASLTTPDGYVTCEQGDFYFGDSLTVTIKVRKVVETKTVYIEYVDEKTNKAVGYEKLVVEKNATYANYSALKEVPEGYETCEVGDFSFNGGVTVTLKVRKIATTKTIYINFYSEDEEKQIKESPLTVAADATYINTSLLTDDIPEGYELCEVGDLVIRDGYVYAAVRKVETPAPVPQTKTVTVFLTCEKGGFFHNLIHHVLKGESYITTVTVEVDADATQVFASDISAYVPAGHKLTANAATITAGSLAEFIVK